jgi:pimeloyl-ACP methyl ester carboxylesterase
MRVKSPRLTRFFSGGLVAGAITTAALVNYSARATERKNPPCGRFVDVDGTKLHYIDRGSGPPIVLLHGNGVSARDWELCGVHDALAANHRVVAFDRPGFGYSPRPRGIRWTPLRQAALINRALALLDVERPVVVGHSWGTLVALGLALDYPENVKRLVLVSGYYFPSLRADAVLEGPPAMPIIGDILCSTVSPILARLLSAAAVAKVFAPAPVPDSFAQLPLSMSRRPSQLRASAQEAVEMVPAAALLAQRYDELTLPIAIIAGEGDQIVDPIEQSNRLALLKLHHDAELVGGAGHMVHYFAPERVVAAVTEAQNAFA